MQSIKFTYPLLKNVEEELKNKVINNHLSHIAVVNSSDILFNFSFYNKEKLFISLNHSSPFISLVDKSFTSSTTLNGLSDNLRKLLKGTYIVDISTINEDRILKFSLNKTNDFYERETFYLIVEFIPTKSNLFILDASKKILFAYHYTDLTNARPIIKGIKYEAPKKKEGGVIPELSYLEYKEKVHLYLVEAEAKRKKESQLPLYNFLVSKRKSLNKKIEVLNKEIETARANLIYKEYGEMIFALLYDEEQLKDYIFTIKDVYDSLLDAKGNANKFFSKYKKAKRTIEMDNIELEKTKDEINNLTTYIDTFNYLDDEEINILFNKYLLNKHNKERKVHVNAKMPFYVKVKDTVIGFGKNGEQNTYLTFKKAQKPHIFLHINEFHGAHVVIFNPTPSNEELLTASEICLILGIQSSGDIKYCPISEIKKGRVEGNVQVNSYKLITLRKIRSETYDLLRNQKRFSD